MKTNRAFATIPKEAPYFDGCPVGLDVDRSIEAIETDLTSQGPTQQEFLSPRRSSGPVLERSDFEQFGCVSSK